MKLLIEEKENQFNGGTLKYFTDEDTGVEIVVSEHPRGKHVSHFGINGYYVDLAWDLEHLRALQELLSEVMSYMDSPITTNVVHLLAMTACQSRSEAKRLVSQGAVKIDGEVIKDPYQEIDKDKVHLKVGRKFEQDVEVKKS